MGGGGDVDHARAVLRLEELREQQPGEGEVAKVVNAELLLEAVGRHLRSSQRAGGRSAL